jgi:hypothetical protein
MPHGRTQREKWDALAQSWYDSGPPSTPSPMDVEIVRRAANGARHRVVLILGCTPSYRHAMAVELDDAPQLIIVVDFSAKMYEVTTEMLRPTWPEMFIQSDWCDDFVSPTAELVIADRALDNVHPLRRRRFFENVRSHMDRGNLFLNHTALTDDLLERCPIQIVVDRWLDHSVNGADRRRCVDGLWDDLLTNSFRRTGSNGVLSLEPLLSDLSRLVDERQTPQQHRRATLVAELLERYGQALSDEWYTSSFEELCHVSAESFEIEDIKWANDYGAAEHHPHFLMRAR